MHSHFADDSMSWRKLCRAAVLAHDPNELSQIIHKMNSALRSRQRWLRRFAGTKGRDIPHASSRLDRAA